MQWQQSGGTGCLTLSLLTAPAHRQPACETWETGVHEQITLIEARSDLCWLSQTVWEYHAWKDRGLCQSRCVCHFQSLQIYLQEALPLLKPKSGREEASVQLSEMPRTALISQQRKGPRQQAAPSALTAYLGSAVLSLSSSYFYRVFYREIIALHKLASKRPCRHQSSEWGLQHCTQDSKALLASRGLWCIMLLPAGKSTSSFHYRKHMRVGAVNWKCSQRQFDHLQYI